MELLLPINFRKNLTNVPFTQTQELQLPSLQGIHKKRKLESFHGQNTHNTQNTQNTKNTKNSSHRECTPPNTRERMDEMNPCSTCFIVNIPNEIEMYDKQFPRIIPIDKYQNQKEDKTLSKQSYDESDTPVFITINSQNKILGKGSFGTVNDGCLMVPKQVPKQAESIRQIRPIRPEYDYHQVAIKKVDLEGAQKQEIEILNYLATKISNEKVISFVTYFNDTKYQYIVTEKAKCSLYDYMKQTKLLFTEKVRWTFQCFEILNFLYDHNIIHKDIKCSNILVSFDNQLKLCDFGNAQFLEKNKYVGPRKVGTFAYFSPEIMNYETFNHKTDVWSMSVSIYYVIYGSYAFFDYTQRKKDLLKEYEQNNMKNKNGTTTSFNQFLYQQNKKKEEKEKMLQTKETNIKKCHFVNPTRIYFPNLDAQFYMFMSNLFKTKLFVYQQDRMNASEVHTYVTNSEWYSWFQAFEHKIEMYF